MNELTDKKAINKWIFFTMNYPYYFIETIWGSNTLFAKHIREKFNEYHGDMNRLYCELDKENADKLLTWVLDNYNDERKLYG